MGINKVKNEIDIIIPSYRLDANFLLPILSIKKPRNYKINYVIVADNPNLTVPKSLNTFIDEGVLKIIINPKNLGAHESRNRGIESVESDWVLFLDDDVIPNNDLLSHYIKAINQKSNPVPGFVGVTRYPKPNNSFTKGIVASDILTFFSLAKSYKEMSWGVTSNLMIRRDAIGTLRFSDDFPKFGGGEDIDLCLNIVSQAGHKFKTIPPAVVNHPWWDNRKNAYKRFFRWAFGDSRLPQRFPEFRYYNFPNVIESLFIAICVGTILFFTTNTSTIYFPLLLGILIGETAGEWTKLAATKKDMSITIAIESGIIRAFNDLGKLIGNLSRGRLIGFFERFDYFCDGKHIKNERKWAFVKFSLYISFISILYLVNQFISRS